MAGVMLSPPVTWVVSTTNSDQAKFLQQNQVPVTERPHFSSDTSQNMTEISASGEIDPVMDHAHHSEESGCDHPDGGLLRESDNQEAETLMHWELPGGPQQEKTETDQDDVKQTETTNAGHHVHDLIEQFESIKTHYDKEDGADGISAIQVHQDESIIDGFGGAIKHAGHTIAEGLDKVARAGHTIVEGLAHTVRHVFPKSQTEKDQGNIGNVHVRNPSLTGSMVGLGMNIHKVNKGHLVQTVAPGGLAHKAKIKNNDIIKKVNDEDVGNWEFEKLQEFFGNQNSIEITLVIERQNGVDENGQPLFVTVTVKIQLSFEDDQVVADIDVTYTSYALSYMGDKPRELPEYFIYQEGSKTSKYLSLSNSFCGMTTKMSDNCSFQMYMYSPSVSSPRVLYNKGMGQPMDLGMKSRIGNDNGELTGSKISTANDKRFFYYRKHKTNLYVFELIARPNYFLTVANDDTVAETYFPNVDSVTNAGLFNTVPKNPDPSKAHNLLQKQGKHNKGIY